MIELLTVVAMIGILAAAAGTGAAKAQKRARIVRAQTTVREITNAILAYQNYDENGSLAQYQMEDVPASESKLGFILGKVKSRGVDVPVLYNAALTRGEIRDPWGRAYRVTIRQGEKVSPPGVSGLKTRVFCPNWHRLREVER